eukprot:1646875-Prymnesium_polylepis.1
MRETPWSIDVVCTVASPVRRGRRVTPPSKSASRWPPSKSPSSVRATLTVVCAASKWKDVHGWSSPSAE